VDVPSLSDTTSSSETEVEGLPLDQKINAKNTFWNP
jgi:hypothetical protein